MGRTTEQTPEEKLGAEFWTQPLDVFTAEFAFLHAQLVGVLREEARARNGSILDFVLIERMATAYIWLRQREAAGTIGDSAPMTDRTRREMNKDFLDLATAMKKMWNSEDKENLGEAILKKVEKAVNAALDGMPEPQARAVKERLHSSFGSAGL